jgi:HAE1 family hydrophobic/amphiphilic exporter-1
MIPLTVQPASDIGLSYKSFGLTLIGGMTAATLLTLLLVPVFYTLFDDAREAFVGIALGARAAPLLTNSAKDFSPRPAGSESSSA